MKPILCVDFDGVIHSYTSGWKGALVISDPPVPGAIKWLWSATQHFEINIYSSRTKEPGAINAMKSWLRKNAFKEFEKDPFRDTAEECVYLFMREIYFPEQKPAAFLTIDDRAVCFDGEWSKLNPEQLLQFKPWNKR